ncbi:hypothetical protein KJ762_12110 [bacterium]|nr:hypothetical protein [bacterium]MBU1635237.1 hypothetical protein [bacterium]MBU1875017.1 hypothetical protein [bacterium]
MNYTHYDFEGLWLATYQKIMFLNSKMNGTGLDKSQLKEVTTSVFIAKVQKGIVRPNDEDDYDFPEPEEVPLVNSNNGNGQSKATPASEKQVITIKGLLKNPKVNPAEKQRINNLLAGNLDKQSASDMLDYFLGQSEKQHGQWIKTTDGVLAER